MERALSQVKNNKPSLDQYFGLFLGVLYCNGICYHIGMIYEYTHNTTIVLYLYCIVFQHVGQQQAVELEYFLCTGKGKRALNKVSLTFKNKNFVSR